LDASCSFNIVDQQAGTWQLQQLWQQQQKQHQHQQLSACSTGTTQHPLGSQLQRQQQPQVQQLLRHQLQDNQSSFQQLQSRRCFSARPLVNPTMPQELATVITEHAAIKAERPPAPTLEPRPLAFESRRSGVIAIKAGMMQDWDEYGVRVPLTVLWIDECMVSGCARFCRGALALKRLIACTCEMCFPPTAHSAPMLTCLLTLRCCHQAVQVSVTGWC
jgi:hypothetical protein